MASIGLVIALLTLGMWQANYRFFEEYTFQTTPYNTPFRQLMTNRGLALDAILRTPKGFIKGKTANIRVTGLAVLFRGNFHSLRVAA